jgi:ribosome-binding factor A
VDTRLKVGRMPEISFAVDTGEKNRQRIDFLLKNQ